MVDIARRVWNHKWKIDPIVRSLLDTDFYKLLMCQSIFRNKPDTSVTFSLINRNNTITLAELIDEGELREQLDHIRSLSLSRGESTWLRGNTFYGKRQMFRPDFMEWFETLKLPAYHLEKIDGQYELTFEGSWPEVMLWEVPALSVLMELRGRAVLNTMAKFELEVFPKDIPLMQNLKFKLKSSNENLENISLNIYATNMFMGYFNLKFENLGGGLYETKGTLPTCPVGNMQWNADIELNKISERIGARFQFQTTR